MTESWHPDENLLLDAALGHAGEDVNGQVGEHLSGCAPCRDAYAELIDGIDLTLPAAPRTPPAPGFETAILERLGHQVERPVTPAAGRRRGSRWFAVAAAGLVGVVAGATIAQLIDRDGDGDGGGDDVAGDVGEAALRTERGDAVGRIARAHGQTGPQLVITLTGGTPAASYTCRIVTADGSIHDAGEWEAAGYGEQVWVVDEPDVGAERVELIGESGGVWATAEL